MSDKAFAVVSNPRHDEYQHGLTSMVYKYSDKSRDTILLTQRLELSKDQQLANKSDTPITREFQRR